MRQSVPMCIIDAFTEVPFAGNQAAVCLIGSEYPSDELLHAIASEMNLAETAFVVSKSNDYKEVQRFDLRWFTPTNEVPLCGHATLASAAALFHVAENKHESVTFSTLSGDLHASKGANGFVNMNLPLNTPVKCNKTEIYEAICNAIFSCPENLSLIDEIWLSTTAKKLVIKMKDNFSRANLENFKPDFDKMLNAHDGSMYKGVIVTTVGDKSKFDFFSRYFSPWNGIPEDHVTGSAHTVLAPFWSNICGKNEMIGRQCSKRGGNVKVKLRTDGRVDVGGKYSIVLNGYISV